MSTWAIWAIEDNNGAAGKQFWAETAHDVNLIQASEMAEDMMNDQKWYGVGLRMVGAEIGSGFVYFSSRYCGPTDFGLLKPRRKKKQSWPELPMEII